jgi:sterol desaturase/sphingolipid hydroxylase (fatty acid hydroxylase superfamily)
LRGRGCEPSGHFSEPTVHRGLRHTLHQLHHSPDPRHFNANYAGLFPWLDTLFGTRSPPPVVKKRSRLRSQG